MSAPVSARSLRGERSKSAPALKDPQYPLTSRNVVVGAAKNKRRAKRSGYQHKAALPTDPQLLYIPSKEHLASKVDPTIPSVPAGVESDTLAKMVSKYMNARVEKTKMKPIYHPSPYTDPITHKEFPAPFFKRDYTKVQGAAGKKAQWLVPGEKEPEVSNKLYAVPRKKAVPKCKKHVDPFQNMKLAPEPIDKGRRRYSWQYTQSKVDMGHVGGSPQPSLSQAEEYTLGKKINRQVLLGNGRYTYAMHGEADRLPGGINKFTKADLPPSYLLKFDNDKKSGIQPSNRGHATRSMTLYSSDDMYAMFGMARTKSPRPQRRSIDITREAHMKAEKAKEEAAFAEIFGGMQPESQDLHASGAQTERWSRPDTELSENTLLQLASLREAEDGRLAEQNGADDPEETDRQTTVRLRSGPGSMISPQQRSSRSSMRSPTMLQSARSPSMSSTGRPSMPQSARGMTRTASDSGIGQAARGSAPGSMVSMQSSEMTSSSAALRAALAQAAASASPSRRDSATGRIMWRSNSSPALSKRPSRGAGG